MTDIRITDTKLEAELEGAGRPVTVRGAGGRVLGTFTPLRPEDRQPAISDEELQRRLADVTAPRYTTDEVLARLRAL